MMLETEMAALDCPPLEPGDEMMVANDPAFATDCKAALGTLGAFRPMRVGPLHFTYVEPWGLICRADFIVGDAPFGDLVNRYVGWIRADGVLVTHIAIGQAIPPLDAK